MSCATAEPRVRYAYWAIVFRSTVGAQYGKELVEEAAAEGYHYSVRERLERGVSGEGAQSIYPI